MAFTLPGFDRKTDFALPGLDLMSFARGAELGNQMNWLDVARDISSRQQEQNLMQQQTLWDMGLPAAQARAQMDLSGLQALREAGQAQADIIQQAVASRPPEERAQFMAEQINQRIRSLNPATQAGAAQVQAFNRFLTRQAAEALRNGDEVNARNILGQMASFTNPLAGQEQLRAKQQAEGKQLFDVLNTAAPGVFVQNPVTGAPMNIAQLLADVERLNILRGGQQPPLSAATTLPPGATPAPVAARTAPAAEPQPTAAAPWSNVRWQDVLNPWSVPNTQLRAAIASRLFTPAANPAPAYAEPPVYDVMGNLAGYANPVGYNR